MAAVPAAAPRPYLVARKPARLTIGIVVHDFALGGTERIAIRLANAWAARGAEVTIFAGAREGPLAALLGPDVRCIVAFPSIGRARGSIATLAAAAAAHFAGHRVDACFVPGNYHWPVAAALARIAPPQRPAIAVQVSAALRKPQRGPVRQLAYDVRMRRLLAGADALVALCPKAAVQADAILRRPLSVPIALPAIDDAAPPPCASPAGSRTILAAGRLVPEKGFDVLIAAFAGIVRGGDLAARLVIVGEGTDRPRLERLIAEHGLSDRVTLPGYVPDIRPWLDACRLFVLPSRFEGYPAVIVEALAAGRPVIATRCTPAVDDLLGDRSMGDSVPIGDAPALAGAIAAMLARPAPDPARVAAIVAPHRIGAVAQAYLHLFRRLVAARAAA